jgi:hypothetical protein
VCKHTFGLLLESLLHVPHTTVSSCLPYYMPWMQHIFLYNLFVQSSNGTMWRLTSIERITLVTVLRLLSVDGRKVNIILPFINLLPPFFIPAALAEPAGCNMGFHMLLLVIRFTKMPTLFFCPPLLWYVSTCASKILDLGLSGVLMIACLWWLVITAHLILCYWDLWFVS